MENAETETETTRAEDSENNLPRQSNLPFAITLAALLIYFGFQTLQLFAQRSELSAVKRSQDEALQASQKVQEQFNSVMTKLTQLAKQGHIGAKLVLDGVQKAGPGQMPGQ